MRKHSLTAALLAALLAVTACAAASTPAAPPPAGKGLAAGDIEPHPLLDSAFEMLEEGNVFVDRYNRLAGRQVVVRYRYGVPYFFGGKKEKLLLYPRAAWQDSRFFVSGQTYVYGFDCHGLTQWVYQANGWDHPKKIADTFGEQPVSGVRIPLMDIPFEAWHTVLPIGALLSIKGEHSNHIMMYVGTLRSYGFAGDGTDADLRPYLDYPLFIQSGYSPAAVRRNGQYIAQLNRPWKIYDTDGGVCVTIVGVPQQAAPLSAQAGHAAVRYFEVEGQELPVYDLSEKLAYYGWYPDTPPKALRTPKIANTRTLSGPGAGPAAAPAGRATSADAAAHTYGAGMLTLPSGPIQTHPVLDSAFEMLEEGNLFLRRYNELTGQTVVPRHQYGAPYLIGGDTERYLWAQRPAARSDSFFIEGQLYLGGFDSIGFTRWAYGQNGWRHPRGIRGITDMGRPIAGRIPLQHLPFDQWRTALPIGALFAVSEGAAHHIMLYIGTLENYGFTEDSLPPDMRPYLHYPLFIQCGKSPAAVRRGAAYIEALARAWPIRNTNGGVCVAMAGVPQQAAPVIGQAGGQAVRGFRLMGQEVTVVTLSEAAACAGWYPDGAPRPLRQPKKVNTETQPVPHAVKAR